MSTNRASISVLHGEAIHAALDALAALRITVFREYPYLYEGTLEYEAKYLRSYASCPESTVVLARAGEHADAPHDASSDAPIVGIVGASTAMPLTEHSDAVVPPLRAAGFDPREVYYFGESILLPAYRGQGLGHRFFDEREAAARRFGYRFATFCAVQRPDDHPRKPRDYVPHDAFWTKRGYVKRPDIVGRFSWLDLGQSEETEKPMLFWVKSL